MSAEPLGQIPLGERLTVRHRLADGRATDSVGTLAARDATSVTLHTREGPVSVDRAAVVVHRVIRPAPWRIATFLRRAGVAVLDLDGVIRGADAEGALAANGTLFAATVALTDELVAAGVPIFALSNGTDRVPEELERIGLGRLVPSLLDTVDLDFTKPAPEAYAAAHARIEERLGRAVVRADVHFTDDRPDNVEAARAFGWQARVFTHPR